MRDRVALRGRVGPLLLPSIATIAAVLCIAAPFATRSAHADPLKDKIGRATGADRDRTTGDRDVTHDDGGEFTDPQHRFTLMIPDGWTKAPPNEPKMVLMIHSPAEGPDDTFSENVNVVVDQVPDNADAGQLDALVRAAIEGVKQQLNAKVIGAVLHATVDGEDARMVTMILEFQGKRVYSQQTYFLHGHNAFVVTYTSAPDTADSVNDTAAGIMDTWHFGRARS